MKPHEIHAALDAIRAALPLATWQAGPPLPSEADARDRSYVGGADGWQFLVVKFHRGDVVGYAVRGTTILRLTRDVAEQACKLAEEKT